MKLLYSCIYCFTILTLYSSIFPSISHQRHFLQSGWDKWASFTHQQLVSSPDDSHIDHSWNLVPQKSCQTSLPPLQDAHQPYEPPCATNLGRTYPLHTYSQAVSCTLAWSPTLLIQLLQPFKNTRERTTRGPVLHPTPSIGSAWTGSRFLYVCDRGPNKRG